eukprot:CAMPEP_0196783932 /NCGR_PEP_ID=MMETSP1104-20130614/15456_1 /TAXON_ID=33652 /ORGANISM="Cafeteria sp., Strain Caron Lab Isolate" /LENGTH=99 /DNA_ID=CAMNT_0042154201 /DNA_START=164 /DNA_END=460 /DNA_ORIENTATION=+
MDEELACERVPVLLRLQRWARKVLRNDVQVQRLHRWDRVVPDAEGERRSRRPLLFRHAPRHAVQLSQSRQVLAPEFTGARHLQERRLRQEQQMADGLWI